jgi:hypothetical protein
MSARVRARVVVVEYNSVVGPSLHWVLPYDATHRWDDSCRFGTGLAALAALGASLGYSLVGCDSKGVNAFFVVNEEAGAFTQRSVRDHFVGPRYLLPYGHPVHYPDPVTSAPLAEEDASRIVLSVRGARPMTITPAGYVFHHLRVENRTPHSLGHPTSNHLPLHVATWWLDESGRRLGGEAERCVQPWSAAPGGTGHLVGRARAPGAAGRYGLVYELVQETVRWLGPTARVTLGPIVVG